MRPRWRLLWSDKTMTETPHPSRNARRTQRYHSGKCSQRHQLTRCVFGGGSRTLQTTFDRLEFIGSGGVGVLRRSNRALYYPGNKEGHIPTRSASEGPMKSSESRRGSPLDD